MFRLRQTVHQVAALPFVSLGGGFEVLLITSRGTRRWLLPKGWPAKARSLVEAARREALDEAGVLGPLHEDPVGRYSYSKTMKTGYSVDCTVFVFPQLVVEHRLSWAEKSERDLRWCGLADAAALVDDRGLARLFSDLADSGGEPLRAAMAAMGDIPAEAKIRSRT